MPVHQVGGGDIATVSIVIDAADGKNGGGREGSHID